MNPPEVFQLIREITRKNGVLCILIGGFAVNYYKVTRQTADVDFLIVKEDYKKIEPFLEKEGFKKYFSQEEIFTRLSCENAHFMDIDFMFVDKETFDKIITAGKKVSIGGQEFIVPSLNNLIALKLHSLKYNLKIRESKDLPDIINLIRINKMNYKNKIFKQLCLKYGTKEIYEKRLKQI